MSAPSSPRRPTSIAGPPSTFNRWTNLTIPARRRPSNRARCRPPPVDAEDVADIAVAALNDDRHVGQVYELTGPRLLTFADAAHEIAEATGRDISYVPVTAEEYQAAATAAGVPAEEVVPLTDLFATVLDGRNARLADGVQRALGRRPRDFRDYARATAASGAWNIAADAKR